MKDKENIGREFKPLRHRLVPDHKILNDEEIQKVLKEYDIEKEQLPKIRISDPAAVEIGAHVGNVIRIIRKSKTAGESNFYRIVIA